MTERQKQIEAAYKAQVGESKVTKKDLADWTAGLYPILRSDTPRLKPDREQFKGIVPGFANAQLPAVDLVVYS